MHGGRSTAVGRLMTLATGSATMAVDRIACDGYGICAELLPERIDLDDWGYPIISLEPITPAMLDHARRAVEMCPVLALRLSALPANIPDRATTRDRAPGHSRR